MEFEMIEDISNHRRRNGSKRTWSELRQEVRNVRRQFSNISAKLPTFFEFKERVAENESRFYRVYFLSTLTSGRETTLLYCDVPVDCIKNKVETFQWKPLLESSFQTYHPQGRFSREEQLQWERKRLVMWGITSYDYQPSVGRFVFPACGAVFYCDDDSSQNPPLFPRELRNSVPPSTRLNPQMCPWDPDLIAYINNFDLWVHNVKSSSDVRLTYARRGNTDIAEDPVSAGIPSYVTQEEFNRYTGYWWQPVSVPAGGDVYRILYEEVDECDVELLHLPCFGDEKEMEVFRFPRAGTSNAKSTLKIVQFSVNADNQIEVLSDLHPNETMQTVCPDFEYLVRAGWTPDGRHVWAEVLDRQQCHEQLVLIPLCCFISSEPAANFISNHVENSPVMQVIYEEKSNVWINVHDILYFFSQDNPGEITFLWASEETGYRHLYIVTVELLFGNDCETVDSEFDEGDCLSQRIKKKIQLTSGEWEVSDLDVWVNEKKRLVYFIGLKDTPLEKHLYVVDIDNPQEPIRLTTQGYSHNIAMNYDRTLFVSIQSNVSQTSFGQVYQIIYSLNYPFKVTIQALGYFLEPSALPSSYRQPELFSHRLKSGHLIYGMLFKPPNMTGEKYPTVLTIYGGPEVQLVTNNFKGMRYLRQYLLSSEGYVVVAIDCRGSRHRGVAFESHIKGRMGTVEIADQVEVLLWLSETTGYIDVDRIAVHGWSYGGYLSLMGIAQRPDIVAIAGAPVTSWMLYDTGYTERYMDTPAKNAGGYTTGSVLSYVHKFPDEENRLLIIHGLRDENVHFAHTTQLINALVKAGKPYQLQIYPTERHSLRHLDASEHYETTLLSFLQQHL
ncbi:LOW QUALITY PROTEIN: dipeptidyl peptidase 9-like [Uloborus diversus]|uniref:LOW QUALITY PROTEIN: dipeptidyl peptidase 9-like n=1 Tax=Uloborus diversus TaxID=327109 RepID=UPI00240A7275|nr:LOW QUALITY PROTEIN: dipeptidyl peptidase 9-like [Uloborus diversus]